MIKGSAKKSFRQNTSGPVVRRYGSDSYKYFEQSRWTIVEGELTPGGEDVDRILFRYCPMKWSDDKKRLSSAERKIAFKAVGKFLDDQKIRWKFSDFGKENWVAR